MKVSYKGIQKELPPKLQAKLDAKFAKLSKLLEKRGEREAHVVVTAERHLHNAEITLQFYDHQLVGLGSDGDLFTAVATALDKLETQAVKQRGKWRGRRRTDTTEPKVRAQAKASVQPKAPVKTKAAAKSAPAVEAEAPAGPRIIRVNHHERRKPMTIEEALLAIEKTQDYMVYRDSEKECVSVLVRRRDGNFDLIES